MKTIKNTFIGLGILSCAGLFFNFKSNSNTITTPENYINTQVKDTSFVKNYNVYALPYFKNLEFCGETVPVKLPDVKERIDREFLVNTYWQSNGFLLLKRAHKYFPTIEKILKEENIPDDFKYLAVIESGLTNVVSPAGARGFWQIMKTTGREYGLEVNGNVDERYHLEKSTRAACKYLKLAKEKFGSWTLAAAAYNAGMNGISRRLSSQQVDNYYDLLLVAETARYIPRIIAIKYILNNPKQFGFNITKSDLYKSIPTKSVAVDTPVTNLSNFAKTFNINYKILKLHNPWLREKHLNNKSRRLYNIDIPDIKYYTK